jgi:hypothetical protein
LIGARTFAIADCQLPIGVRVPNSY